MNQQQQSQQITMNEKQVQQELSLVHQEMQQPYVPSDCSHIVENNGASILEKLAIPFLDDEIEWKVQSVFPNQRDPKLFSALIVPYVSARAIHNRLNQVCGLDWTSDFRFLPIPNCAGIECTISIFHQNRWVSRRDAAEFSQIEALKGAYSDSMKRSAVQFGIGSFLYKMPKTYVDIVEKRPYNDAYESVNSKYKVNGQQTYVKGFFIRPSASQILAEQANSKKTQKPQQAAPAEQQQHGQQRSQQQKSYRQSPPSNQQQQGNPTNQPPQSNKPVTERDYMILLQNISSILNELQFDLVNLPYLFNLVNAPKYQQLNHANYVELQRLHDMINPIRIYMGMGRDSLGLSEEDLFNYAANFLREPIQAISDMFLRLDNKAVNLLINEIREAQFLSQRQQQRRA